MKVEEFFARYEDDEQMMSQMFAASKDESTLVEFLGRHGVAVEPAGKKKEMSDEEMSHVSGGQEIMYTETGCLLACNKLTNRTLRAACKMACVLDPM